MSLKSLLLSVLVVFNFSISNTYSQANKRIHNQFRFKHITIDQGLSNNKVTYFEQDSYGIIWMGTPNGLNKYDGYNIINYFSEDSNLYTIPNSAVGSILCDSRKNLWIGTSGGLSRYNYDNDNFIQITSDILPDGFGAIRDIQEDREGHLWMASFNGLYNYDPITEQVEIFRNDTSDPHSLSDNNLVKLIIDKNNNIWLSTDNNGVIFLNTGTFTFTNYQNNPQDNSSLQENKIYSIYEDKNGTIWFGSDNNGIAKFDPGSKTFQRFYFDRKYSGSGRVRAIFEDKSGNFWLGTMAGLYLFNPNTGTFFRYAHSKHPISTLSHNSIQTALIDNQEGLWLGTFAGGASYTNLFTSGFINFEFSSLENNYFINDKVVYCFAEDKAGNIWVGTEHGGLNYLNRQTGLFTYFLPDPENPNSLLSDNIKVILYDDAQNLWIGTSRGGLSYYNTRSGKFTNYLHDPEDPHSIVDNHVYALCFDDNKNLWVGTYNGLCVKKYGNDSFTPKLIMHNNKALPIQDWVEQIVKDHNGVMWIGGVGMDGIIKANPAEEYATLISNLDGHDLSESIELHIDVMGNLWFGTKNKQLIRLNPGTNDCVIFDQSVGLPDVNIMGILDDDEGNIWISSNDGLYNLVNLLNSTNSVHAKRYTKSDGLQSKQFINNAKMKSSEGELFFGGINGFNSFFPEKVVDNPFPPALVFTGLRVNNKPVHVNQVVLGNKLLERSISETKDIKMNHRIKIFTIEFAGLHYVAPEKNKYSYILEGYDEWTDVDASRRFATYSNLPPGKYVFKVKASNNSGTWNETPLTLNISVSPPFWKTVWFLLLVLIAVVVLVVFFIKWREQQLKKDKELLESKLKTGAEELQLRKNEIEKQRLALEEKERAEFESNWFNKGMAIFSEIISKEKENLEILSKKVISNIVEYVDAPQGGMYFLNDTDSENEYLELIASYAFNREKLEKVNFYPGEGLVGSCYQSKEMIEIDNLPEEYAKLESGLGERKLEHLVLIPIILDEDIMGVIELASFEKLASYKIDFVGKLSESIASVVITSKANEKVKEMYRKTHIQAEELQAQEEEMKQNLEEMKATQEEANRREQKLLKQLEDNEKAYSESLKQKENIIEKLKKSNTKK